MSSTADQPLTVVCWKWTTPGYRSQFTGAHVNTLRNMVARHLHIPHEFACITDDPTGIDSDVRIIPLWDDLRELGRCYVRLKAFSREARELIAPRFLSIDLDTVIVDDITPLATRQEDFVIAALCHRWHGLKSRRKPYNGSMWLLTAGARPQVWEDFDPQRSPGLTREKGLFGSDQAWLAYRLGRREAVWTEKHGVLRYARSKSFRGRQPPRGARIIFFAGQSDPWKESTRAVSPWVAHHFR